MTQDLRTTELDFDSIKANLKAFLSSKPEFSDYNFEGSGLSTLMDLLAYNTHYMAMLSNLQTADLYLDTATKLSTVALSAKRLGYLPKSRKSATALVDLEIFTGTNQPTTLTIGRNAEFTSTSGGTSFTFVTTEAKTITRSSDGRYVFKNLEIKEGVMTTFKYLYQQSNPAAFVIPTRTVDIDTLTVRVQQSATNASTLYWSKNRSIADNTADSKVYYVKMNRNGYYEVEFGDGVLSKAIEDGNIVILEYLECSGSVANEISYFTFNDNVEGYNSNIVTLVSQSAGGAEIESLDSIKKHAQEATSAQDRAVSESDYKSAVWDIYPYDDVSIWGGEKNDPPEYGKVFICIKPLTGQEFISQATKSMIENSLVRKQSIVTTKPVFVDPDYTYLELDCSYYYDDTITRYAESTINMMVLDAIKTFASQNINKFQSILSLSKLQAQINSVGDYITSNIMNLRIRKNIPLLNIQNVKTVHNFYNPIKKSNSEEFNIYSSWFKLLGSDKRLYIDDVNGVLRAYYRDGDVRKTYKENIGTVDYTTGKIVLEKLDITESENGVEVVITAIPKSPDVISVRNSILQLDETKVNIDGIVESKNKTEHIFVAGR